jgi:hypothetical protein
MNVDDGVIEFKVGARITPKRQDRFCRHQHVLVVQATRKLECEHCGAVVEPFDFMWEWANRRLNLEYSRNRLKEQIKRLEKRLEALKREERNVKARISRALKKDRDGRRQVQR